MNKEDFFYINEIDNTNNVIKITLNPHNAIYDGHFPSQPVTPGVCSVQIIKQCTEQILNLKLALSAIRQCKFKSLISPVLTPNLIIVLDEINKENNIVLCKAHIDNQSGDTLLTIKCTFNQV